MKLRGREGGNYGERWRESDQARERQRLVLGYKRSVNGSRSRWNAGRLRHGNLE